MMENKYSTYKVVPFYATMTAVPFLDEGPEESLVWGQTPLRSKKTCTVHTPAQGTIQEGCSFIYFIEIHIPCKALL